ncbi:MAG TPA: ANTAR domain-containing protein [Streptosporangiaceae bacterium]|nr:ANTAR domain-containing protein [Streptosporangiaceae bacterium]
MNNRDLLIAEELAELAESADNDGGEAGTAAQLTVILAELFSPAEIALLLSDQAGGVTVAAASGGGAYDLASFEVLHGEGPLTECMRLAQPALNERVEALAARWPAFAAAANAAGFRVVSVLPLQRREQGIGAALVLVAREEQLTTADVRAAQILTRAAAFAVAQQRELADQTRIAVQLQRALDSRVLVEQAKGATAARLGITPDAACGLLRSYARRENRMLADVARQTIGGELSAHDLVGRLSGRTTPALHS